MFLVSDLGSVKEVSGGIRERCFSVHCLVGWLWRLVLCNVERGGSDALLSGSWSKEGEVAPRMQLDNDTLREVPHLSDEGLALQARVSGPWPHEKESVLQVKLALLARCKSKLLWTE